MIGGISRPTFAGVYQIRNLKSRQPDGDDYPTIIALEFVEELLAVGIIDEAQATEIYRNIDDTPEDVAIRKVLDENGLHCGEIDFFPFDGKNYLAADDDNGPACRDYQADLFQTLGDRASPDVLETLLQPVFQKYADQSQGVIVLTNNGPSIYLLG